MTKRRALGALGFLAGFIGVLTAGTAHVLWGLNQRRQSMLVLFGGAALDSLLVTAFLVPNFPLKGRNFHRGSSSRNWVALSFDDGPRPPFTDQILDILRDEAVPATFFVLGDNALKFPELVKRMEKEGHRVANHGMDHDILMWARGNEARNQVQKTDRALKKAGVTDPAPLFRAPHGWLSPLAHRAISSSGYQVTGWTKGVWDTASPGIDKIVSRTREVLGPGSVLLLHDGWAGQEDTDRSQTAQALTAIIREARARGLKFVTIEEMIRAKEAAD